MNAKLTNATTNRTPIAKVPKAHSTDTHTYPSAGLTISQAAQPFSIGDASVLGLIFEYFDCGVISHKHIVA